ncbi:hypothetical protein SpCBS45565_g07946 [Spizellomyces sp. 'palustris']|nr:hypothetical protein SpCBS45565_g07946 [Spizellomyces sp. 'palustris']
MTGLLLSSPSVHSHRLVTRSNFLLTVLLTFSLLSVLDLSCASARQLHPLCCSPTDVATLASLSTPENLTKTGSTLSPFLIPRVSGTEGNVKVQNHLISTFEALKWHVEQDKFTDNTPFGVKPFNNIIVTKNPDAPRKLVLAAHFDSKYFLDFDFIGATDSAVPCAILVDVATTLNPYLEREMFPSTTLQLIFFDGEEAFVSWSETDSLYGSRHLAAKWESTYVMGTNNPQSSGMEQRADPQNNARTILEQIDVFILLDLLGTPEVRIWNSHKDTASHWTSLVDIQHRLSTSNLLSKQVTARIDETGEGGYFMKGESGYSAYQIEDDHKPFMQRGVPIVHVIPQMFPAVWHRATDNAAAIEPQTVHDFALIFRVFVAEYLGLEI